MHIATLCGLAPPGGALALPSAGLAYQPVFLTPAEFRLTEVLAELIIPATDTPGATAVSAHRVIDTLLGACSSARDQQRFTHGLAMLDASAVQRYGQRYTALVPARQAVLLRALDTGKAPFTPEHRAFFVQLKSLTLFAYYTSKAGAMRGLNCLPVPGSYKSSVAFGRLAAAGLDRQPGET